MRRIDEIVGYTAYFNEKGQAKSMAVSVLNGIHYGTEVQLNLAITNVKGPSNFIHYSRISLIANVRREIMQRHS